MISSSMRVFSNHVLWLELLCKKEGRRLRRSLPANNLSLCVRLNTHTSIPLLLPQYPLPQVVSFVAGPRQPNCVRMVVQCICGVSLRAGLPNAGRKIGSRLRVRLAVPVHDQPSILDCFLMGQSVRFVKRFTIGTNLPATPKSYAVPFAFFFLGQSQFVPIECFGVWNLSIIGSDRMEIMQCDMQREGDRVDYWETGFDEGRRIWAMNATVNARRQRR